jgi:hypothetical protein
MSDTVLADPSFHFMGAAVQLWWGWFASITEKLVVSIFIAGFQNGSSHNMYMTYDM